jgi:hypothetical protein
MTAYRLCLSSLVLLGWVGLGCDSPNPTEPVPPASFAASTSGPKVNAPSGTAAVAVSEYHIDVSWQDNSINEIGFEIHRSTGSGGTFGLWVTTGPDVAGYAEFGLTPSTQYCYQVRALRKTGNKTSYSAFSSPACATTPDLPAPAAPSQMNATPGGSTAVWVGWADNSSTEAGSRIERSLDLGTTWATAGTLGADQYPSFFDGERVSEEPVCYRVFAFNAGGDSPPSAADCTTPPAGPTDLTATLDEATYEVNLTWTDNSGVEDSYEVLADGYWSVASLPANTTSFRFQWYFYADYFTVVAMKDGGFSDASNAVTPTIP